MFILSMSIKKPTGNRPSMTEEKRGSKDTGTEASGKPPKSWNRKKEQCTRGRQVMWTTEGSREAEELHRRESSCITITQSLGDKYCSELIRMHNQKNKSCKYSDHYRTLRSCFGFFFHLSCLLSLSFLLSSPLPQFRVLLLYTPGSPRMLYILGFKLRDLPASAS